MGVFSDCAGGGDDYDLSACVDGIYIELSSIRGNFMANIILRMIENYHFLPHTDGCGSLGSGGHTFFQCNGHTQGVCPAGVITSDGLHALYDTVYINALGQAKIPL